MPRPENPELRANIVRQAQRLFREKGYRAASYADIAQAAGITKGLVQYYFPKKELLATELMRQTLKSAIAVLGIGSDSYQEQGAGRKTSGKKQGKAEGRSEASQTGAQAYDRSSDLARACRELYQMGQVYFAYLLGPGGYRLFMGDVVSSFDLIDSVLAFNIDWAVDYAGRVGKAPSEEGLEGTIMAMGGFYSLLHYHMKHGGQIDVPRHLGTVMHEFMRANGVGERRARQVLEQGRFTQDELEALARKME